MQELHEDHRPYRCILLCMDSHKTFQMPIYFSHLYRNYMETIDLTDACYPVCMLLPVMHDSGISPIFPGIGIGTGISDFKRYWNRNRYLYRFKVTRCHEVLVTLMVPDTDIQYLKRSQYIGFSDLSDIQYATPSCKTLSMS